MSPQSAGMIMALQPLLMALLSPFMGKLSDHYEPRYLTASDMCLISIGLPLFLGNTPPLSPEHYPALLQSIHISLSAACALSVVGIYLSMARGNLR